MVHILDDHEYCVLRINPQFRLVVLGRIDASSNQRTFMTPSTTDSVFTVTTKDAEVLVGQPTPKCPSEYHPPLTLFNTVDVSTSCNFELTKYAPPFCPEFESVNEMAQGFDDAKTQPPQRVRNAAWGVSSVRISKHKERH